MHEGFNLYHFFAFARHLVANREIALSDLNFSLQHQQCY